MRELKILNTFSYLADADRAKNYLESVGINVMLKDELTVQVNNLISNAVGGIKLMVRSEDYDRGLQVLEAGGFIVPQAESKKQKVETVKLTVDIDEIHCPYCNSENISKEQRTNPFLITLYFLFGEILPSRKEKYICFGCSKQWKFKK